jgi:uncharacterized membrane protein
MTRDEFLHALGAGLGQLPADEAQKQLDYYSELLDDMMEDGVSEAEAVAKLGAPEELAAQILQEQPLSALVSSRLTPRKGWSALSITLAVAGSPVWLPIALALFAVVLSIYIVIWAVVAVLFCTTLALALSALALIVTAFMNIALFFPQAMLFLGSAVFCAGLTVLLYLGSLQTAKAMVKLTALLGHKIKSVFIRKEVAA